MKWNRYTLSALAAGWVAVLLCCPAAGIAQNLLLRDYSTRDGLPDSRVAPIIQDRDGYIWFGTQAGLTRFDGREFRIFGPAHEIPGIFGRSILQDHVGAIWFGYSGFNTGGLLRAWNGPRSFISSASGLAGKQVFDVAEGQNGDLWAATDAGLERIHFTDPLRLHWSIKGPFDTSVSALHVDRDGALWYASANGLFHGDTGRFERVCASPAGDTPWHVRPYSFYETRTGDLWFGTYNGAYVVRRGGVFAYGHREGVPPRGVWCFQEDNDGTLWAGTMEGLYRVVRNGERIRFVKEQSFGDGVVYDMCLDREGNLWFASAPGLRRLLAKNLIVPFSGEQTLSTPGFGPIVARTSGTVFFGSRSSGLFELTGSRVVNRSDYGPVSTYTITTLYDQPDAGLWAGLWRGGVVLLRPEGYRLFTVRDGLPSNDVHAISRTLQGRMVFGTSAGLAWQVPGRALSHLSDPMLGDPAVFDLKSIHGPSDAVGVRDTLWAATDRGAMGIVLDSSGVRGVERIPGCPELENRIVYEILVDSHRRLWFGTDGAGTIRWDGRTATAYTEPDGLVGNRVYALAEDSLGQIWIGTSSGLSCFDGSGFRNFDFDQGFGEIGVHGLVCDRQGYLWVSSFPDIKKLRPTRFHKSGAPPPLYITDVQVEERHLTLEGAHELQPDPAVITFRFAALSFTDERNVRYKYHLGGFDSKWSDPVMSREIRYTHLPPGSYTFRIIARSGDGVWSREPLAFTFTILPPLWLRWWFIAAATGILIAGVYALYRYRLNKLLELERTRSTIAMDLHDDIGSSLTRISVMTDVAQRREMNEAGSAAEYLARVGETARELIEALGDIVWTVDPKHDTLQNAIRRIVQFGQDMCEGKGIEFETELSGTFEHVRLAPELRRDIYLVFKEGIHNIVKHSGASRARFCVRPTRIGVQLELLDNGAGLPDVLSGEGHGLPSIRERGRRAGASFDISTKRGEGTRISLELRTG